MLTQERLKELLTYDPATGIFRWRVARSCGARGRTKPGDIAGAIQVRGCIDIGIDGKQYKAHRLAFLYMTGTWPAQGVDHRDLDPTNNAWGNLREANQSQNMANRRAQKNNKLGVKGVSQIGSKYYARININGTRIHLGSFHTIEAAAAQYAEAAAVAFDDFARVA
jgi:hypothetical protein